MPRTFVWWRTRGPRHTPKEESATSGKVRIEQVRSGIGRPATMRQTLVAMGLRHHLAVITVLDWPSLRGHIKMVRHVVKVTPVEE